MDNTMTRFAILALTTIAALLTISTSPSTPEVNVQTVTVQGNCPQSSQISGTSVFRRLVVAQGEASIVRMKVQNITASPVDQADENLPVIADDSDLPSEFWQLRPQVQQAFPVGR